MARGSKPGERRGGRIKGIPNKLTADLKEMILTALDEAGGIDYLKLQSRENPTAFMTLIGKVLPLQIKGDPTAPLFVIQAPLVEQNEDEWLKQNKPAE